ncbi:MAG: hypothetical protein K2L50_00680 [Bacteroidales bacterium]|nr:hypothetical protein [Bacteroidales bacterium]
MNEQEQKEFNKAWRVYLAYERKQILKCMFTRYKENREFSDIEIRGLYFLLWLKALICLLFNWRRSFNYKDNPIIVCTTDAKSCMDSEDWITCEVSRSPFVWGVSIYNDWN